jgi:transcriptional regulator with XRE-family HTH domain
VAQVPERLKELRRASGLTQEELGERVGLTRLAVQNMERGTRKVTAEDALALAHAMGVRIGTLVGEPESQQTADLRFEVSVRLLPQEGSAPPTALLDLLRAVESKQTSAGSPERIDLAAGEQIVSPRRGRTRARVESRKGKK